MRRKDSPASPNRGIDDEAFRNYADYMSTNEFRQGVTTLLEIARSHRTVIMCAEGDYRNCHRRLLSDQLVANNFAVRHIFPNGELKPHALTLGAKVTDVSVTYPGQPTLFDM